MNKMFSLLLLLAAALPPQAVADDVRETPISHSTERHLPGDETFMQWTYDPETLDQQGGDWLQTVQVETVEPKTVKLTGIVKPIYFESGVADIPAKTVEELRSVLDDMRDRNNVRLNLVGHADNERLSPRLTTIYGDNFGLSREREAEVLAAWRERAG